jgi:hypothetical protein
MFLIGSARALRCSCGGTLLVGKDVQPLQSVKPIRIAVSTVLDESWCGHKLVFGLGMFSWRELFSGKVCDYVPGLLRTGSPVVPNWVFSKQLSYLGYKNGLRKPFRN